MKPHQFSCLEGFCMLPEILWKCNEELALYQERCNLKNNNLRIKYFLAHSDIATAAKRS